jgi:hypothetical protein
VAEAATAAAQTQTIIDNLAGAAAEGKIPWDDYATAVQSALDALNEVPDADRGVPLPFVGDRARQPADFELESGNVPQLEPVQLEVQLHTELIEQAVGDARGIVEGFTDPAEAYEAVMTMDIADVETKAGLVKALLAEIPETKELTINVTATGMHFLEELAAIGALPN